MAVSDCYGTHRSPALTQLGVSESAMVRLWVGWESAADTRALTLLITRFGAYARCESTALDDDVIELLSAFAQS